LLVMLVLGMVAVSPFVWNYLESYESTDDAQIDGHIEPLSSRVDGTVIAVHVEDDELVARGELLVELDPRDYQVAFEQAAASLELTQARVAAARQDYAVALALIREDDATNFRAQRDAQRCAALWKRKWWR
jgi:membrane fusion protein, multidrug efflux system